ncbi:LA_2272/LA_2273 family lipoprotein [Leptospira stimsonii]|uniref:PPE family protein n=1 Tax=Leptospira stimsonii TaxID=2202203 RepID=A0ABY2MUX9_9LEPT|nr:hypothetical protein [Leptospira stimsonii]TGK25348.1 hypothetical protein EHO98_02805 [Leptospira stimsonii]TGM08767.1 hypothetical protein EHQ90_21990 [Leptospira stimsonii]
MKHKNPLNYFSILSFVFASAFVFTLNCGVGGLRGEKSFVRAPVKTETELVRVNLLYGEVKNLYGVNLGIINSVKDRLIGVQVGGVNFSDGKTYGAQLSLYNEAKNGSFTVQAGGVNKVENAGTGLQLGLYNAASNSGVYFTAGIYNKGSSGATIGLINDEGLGINIGGFNYGYGVNLGLINSGKGLSIGAINMGEDGNFQIGVLNFCSDGPFPIMIGINYCIKSSAPVQEKAEAKTTPIQ